MKIYTKKNSRSRESISNVPNSIAYKFIRNFINGKDFN